MGGGESGSIDAVVVLTTVDQPDKARQLARALVEAQLAACVSLANGLTSVYRWEDDIEEATETLLLIKTRKSHLQKLEAWFSDHHPYDVPEFLALEVSDGSDAYLSWLEESTRSQEVGD